MIKLIAVDMDGTALNSRKEITSGTVAAVRAARQAGAKVVVATGRIAGEAAVFAREMGADREMIVAGGAALADAVTGKNCTEQSIAPEICAAVLERVQQHKARFMAYAGEKLYSRPGDVAEWLRGGGRTEGAAQRHVTSDNPAQLVRENGARVNKIFVGATPETLEALTAELRGTAGISITRSAADNIEIMPEGADKGVALRALAAQLGIDIAQTLAIGDSDNDRAMLLAAGTAVVMANGDAAMLALADFVTDDNDHDGVAAAIYHYLPEAVKPSSL